MQEYSRTAAAPASSLTIPIVQDRAPNRHATARAGNGDESLTARTAKPRTVTLLVCTMVFLWPNRSGAVFLG